MRTVALLALMLVGAHGSALAQDPSSRKWPPPREDWRTVVVHAPADVAGHFTAVRGAAADTFMDHGTRYVHGAGEREGLWHFPGWDVVDLRWHPKQALRIEDTSTPDDYAITFHVLCEQRDDACAALEAEARTWFAPVQHEACKPGPVSMPPPAYPEDRLRMGITGTVIVLMHTNACGQVRDVQISRSSGDRALDMAAMAAVRRWRIDESGVGEVPITFVMSE